MKTVENMPVNYLSSSLGTRLESTLFNKVNGILFDKDGYYRKW